MATEEDINVPALQSQLTQTQTNWKLDMVKSQFQVDALQEKLTEVKDCIQGSEADAKKELNVLWRRVKTSSTLLMYLKSKAKIVAVPHLAHTSCGIKQLNGVGLVDRNGVPLSRWSRNVDISSYDFADEETVRKALLMNKMELILVNYSKAYKWLLSRKTDF